MPDVKLPEIPDYLTANQITYNLKGREISLHNVKVYLKNPFEILIEAGGGDLGGIKFPNYKTPLKFATNEGWEVEIGNIFIDKVGAKIKGNTTKLRAVNGAFGENDEVEVYLPIGDFYWLSRRDPENPMLKIGFVQFEPEPLANTKFYELDQPNIEGYSAFLIYTGLRNAAREFIKTTWDDLYWLISLGLGRRAIASHRFIRYKNGLEVEIIPGVKQKAFYIPLDFYGHNKMEYYINSCFDSYVNYKSELGFNKLIDWYILMNQTSFYLLKFLIGVVLLESLKHRFAKNIKQYKQDSRHRFLNANRNTIEPKKLLGELKAYFSSPDGRFIGLFDSFRNQIIHEGGFSEDSGFSFGDAYILQNSIGKLLFKILGYPGEIEEQDFCEF